MGWIVLVALALWLIAVYNGVVGLRSRFKNAFFPLGIPLELRDDLIRQIPRPAWRS